MVGSGECRLHRYDDIDVAAPHDSRLGHDERCAQRHGNLRLISLPITVEHLQHLEHCLTFCIERMLPNERLAGVKQ